MEQLLTSCQTQTKNATFATESDSALLRMSDGINNIRGIKMKKAIVMSVLMTILLRKRVLIHHLRSKGLRIACVIMTPKRKSLITDGDQRFADLQRKMDQGNAT